MGVPTIHYVCSPHNARRSWFQKPATPECWSPQRVVQIYESWLGQVELLGFPVCLRVWQAAPDHRSRRGVITQTRKTVGNSNNYGAHAGRTRQNRLESPIVLHGYAWNIEKRLGSNSYWNATLIGELTSLYANLTRYLQPEDLNIRDVLKGCPGLAKIVLPSCINPDIKLTFW